jgi:hypothetical protein
MHQGLDPLNIWMLFHLLLVIPHWSGVSALEKSELSKPCIDVSLGPDYGDRGPWALLGRGSTLTITYETVIVFDESDDLFSPTRGRQRLVCKKLFYVTYGGFLLQLGGRLSTRGPWACAQSAQSAHRLIRPCVSYSIFEFV